MSALRKVIFGATAAVVLTAGLAWNGGGRIDGRLFSEAEARVGRPLTPMSYAGVARRTTRRAVAVGAAATAGAAAYGAYGPGCVQVVDAYGRVIRRC